MVKREQQSLLFIGLRHHSLWVPHSLQFCTVRHRLSGISQAFARAKLPTSAQAEQHNLGLTWLEPLLIWKKNPVFKQSSSFCNRAMLTYLFRASLAVCARHCSWVVLRCPATCPVPQHFMKENLRTYATFMCLQSNLWQSRAHLPLSLNFYPSPLETPGQKLEVAISLWLTTCMLLPSS